MKNPDVSVSRQGSIWLFLPLTRKAKAWVKEHISLESWQWIGNYFAVDHRFAENLVQGMIGDGLLSIKWKV